MFLAYDTCMTHATDIITEQAVDFIKISMKMPGAATVRERKELSSLTGPIPKNSCNFNRFC
jgi:hypothetical protein